MSVEKKIEKIAVFGEKKKLNKILKYVEAKEPELRAAAAKALANIKVDESYNALTDLIRDQDVAVRRQAVISLGIFGRKAGAEHVRGVMSRPENAEFIADCQSAITAILNSNER